MKIDDFVLENWLNPACDSEKNRIYLGGSCVSPITVKELFELTGESMESFMKELSEMNLGYGRFEGTPRTRKAISGLYKGVKAEEVILVHGGTGANNTVVFTLLDPSDNIISIMPNYQQFHSIPKSMGVEVRDVHLKAEQGYKLDLAEVRNAVDENTKAIMFTNPNNPTGSLLELSEMEELIEIAKSKNICLLLPICMTKRLLPAVHRKFILWQELELAGSFARMKKCVSRFLTAVHMTRFVGAYLMSGFLRLRWNMWTKFLNAAEKSSTQIKLSLTNGWMDINICVNMRRPMEPLI